jgi:hypothetical protein
MKPCPICGADAIVSSSTIVTDHDMPVHWVQCADPSCAFAGPYRTTESDAVLIWDYVARAVNGWCDNG